EKVIDFMINTSTSMAGVAQTGQTVVAEAPPPAPVETMVVAPGPGYVWVGGDWIWNGGWVWMAGQWIVPPYPHAIWIHGGWERSGRLFACYKQATPGGVSKTRKVTRIFSFDHPPWFFKMAAMANTYWQIYLQVVFAVEDRQSLIRRENKEELHKYLTGVVTQRGQKLLAVHCMPDHAHILIGLRPAMALSDLVHDVKIASANFVN